ncbi:glutamine synthetase III [Clostridium sp. MD294]|uniref:glutamine synthetase III family protein n=1 Tax=Clostridium sp. MD294 TaxID=97138 RepID=UPI0002CB22D6|nr:glutamine synthetase III [Clostridium sp. MD294]NDO45782.1 glutamine synthetase type III [Clostridium sp. MD294]USF30563.1 Glutamine synthetase [Clostridium sp. MD294]
MQEKISIVELYGTNVFNDAQMREHLPKRIYTELQHTIEEGAELNASVAEVVANAMKDWAMERGATHFTHWFQPMTGITAEKHDSFLTVNNGKAITEFSGKELIKGESDASSFPSGGLRATFEARGYTAWDCTSPAFLREDSAGVTLCIPTAFCSYTGEALDKKTPLLRSVEAINKQALRVLRLFGNTTSKKINIYAGAEQEYFLIDRELYKKRKDLIFTGRTLFGAAPPKGQELDDHYFGSIKERIAKFMNELNIELWKMGVSAKTQHNEVAPAQHELALIYDTCNIATDHNQLVMKSMKRIASHHGLACLLHEKPFAGVNGSGKHNNWSIGTDDGQNLLDPGKTPHENAQFLLFLVAIIKAVDLHAALIRHSASNPGNDHRLGAGEAPPAIVSIFLGDQLTDIFEQIEHGEATSSIQGGKMKVGVNTLPILKKDATDRNRTSPFAFTGNKFEFRMVPSSGSISGPNFILNTVVADVLKEFADILEKAEDFTATVHDLIHKTYVEHKRVIFNGNGYSEEWIEEAEKRGLPNLPTMVDAIPALTYDTTVETFERHKVLSRLELQSRAEIHYESYIKQINIEAKTMIDIASKQILPVIVKYKSSIAQSLSAVKEVEGDISIEEQLLCDITENIKLFYKNLKILEQETEKAHHLQCSNQEQAIFYRDHVAKAMEELRKPADKLEMLVDEDIWPFPTYGELLFNI